MELIKQGTPLEFKFEDATFLVKKIASAGDRIALTMGGAASADGSTYTQAAYCKKLAELMVVGWRNVQIDGKEAPYSFELFESSFPFTPGNNVFLALFKFISENTDILPKETADALKNA